MSEQIPGIGEERSDKAPLTPRERVTALLGDPATQLLRVGENDVLVRRIAREKLPKGQKVTSLKTPEREGKVPPSQVAEFKEELAAVYRGATILPLGPAIVAVICVSGSPLAILAAAYQGIKSSEERGEHIFSPIPPEEGLSPEQCAELAKLLAGPSKEEPEEREFPRVTIKSMGKGTREKEVLQVTLPPVDPKVIERRIIEVLLTTIHQAIENIRTRRQEKTKLQQQEERVIQRSERLREIIKNELRLQRLREGTEERIVDAREQFIDLCVNLVGKLEEEMDSALREKFRKEIGLLFGAGEIDQYIWALVALGSPEKRSKTLGA